MGVTPAAEKRTLRRRVERDRQRGAILDAALQLFAFKGYVRTSVHDVADAAGFSVGHIYNLVGNKETLFDAIMLREGEELARMATAATKRLRGQSAGCRIDGLIDAVLQFFNDHRSFFKIYLEQTGGMPAEAQSRLSRTGLSIVARFDRLTLRLIREGIAEGSVAPLHPQDGVIALQNLLKGFVAHWILSGCRDDAAERAEIVKQLLWKGIGGGRPAPRQGRRQG
jgi:AcrR family transcriptional regulator